MNDEIPGWAGKVHEQKEKRRRRAKILIIFAAIVLLPVLAVGIVAYLTNPDFDDFTEWHAEHVREKYEPKVTWQNFHPSTPAERRKFYGPYVERKSYIFFSLYVSRAEFGSLDRAALPFVCTPARMRNTLFGPSQFPPKGWKPRILYVGLFGSIREYESRDDESVQGPRLK